MKDRLPTVKHDNRGFTYIARLPKATAKGTPYLTGPGTHLIAKTETSLDSVSHFLGGFDAKLDFHQYLSDPTKLDDGAELAKFAGQLCYVSFGPKRTTNENADKYFANIKDSGHGSVLEHPTYSFLLYGISRSVTHEVVRHRAGFAYSQVSQRYVGGNVLRFVERPEYAHDPKLHEWFEADIDRAFDRYKAIADRLLEMQEKGVTLVDAEFKTDRRKRVQQAARSRLPNETEAPIIMTGNGRSWRHFIEMRANEHAEIEIRNLAYQIYLCLKQTSPIIFNDYETVELPDGTFTVKTSYPKV